MRLRAGDGSQNVQAQIANFGVNYEDARAIALDVCKEYFAPLSKAAFQKASERAEEFNLNYLSELHRRHPMAIQNISEPGVQLALLDAQVGYADSADADLGQVLVDLLVDRTASTSRDIKQLSLNEAISVAKKLTTEHFKALTLSLVVTRTKVLGLGNYTQLYEWMRKLLIPFGESLSITDSDVSHLESVGCLTIGLGKTTIPASFLLEYPGLFAVGFSREATPEKILAEIEGEDGDRPRICPNLRNRELLQANAVDQESFERCVTGLSDPAAAFLKSWFENKIPAEDITRELVEFDSRFEAVIRNWGTGPLSSATLSPVGIAIGHANARRVLMDDFTADLSTWIR